MEDCALPEAQSAVYSVSNPVLDEGHLRMPLSYREAFDIIHSFDDPYLAAIRDHGKQTWGLDAVRALLGQFGDPHRAYPSIHIAGSKGKGSTAAFIAQGLIEAGLKTGLYISPHLQDWRERIQIDRQLIAEATLAQLVEEAKPYLVQVPGLSSFEVTTALALWHFAREGCEVTVIEVGLGGRLDATSVVEPVVAVITNISLDHTQLLGDTLEQIAAEKAAIVKPGVPIVSAPQQAEAQSVIERRAQERGSHLILTGRDWLYERLSLSWEGSEALIGEAGSMQPYRIGLPGAFQIENAAVALAALREAEQAGLSVGEDARRKGIAHTRWPGRLEVVSHEPLIILDSAHNPYSVGELIESLEILIPDREKTFIFGCMADKDIDRMLAAILPAARRVILTRAEHARATAPEELQSRALALLADERKGDAQGGRDVQVSVADHVAGAIQEALGERRSEEALCITGSLAMAGEARSLLLSRDAHTFLQAGVLQPRKELD